jgi:hypothetical protein
MMGTELATAKDLVMDPTIAAFGALVTQYPELEPLADLVRKNDMGNFRRQYPGMVVGVVAKALGIPTSGITLFAGFPYINVSGLLCRTQKDPRKVKRITAHMVFSPVQIDVKNMPEEAKQHFIGVTEGTAVYKGIVEFADGSVFEATGTASKQNIRMSTMHTYLLEMAETRAKNRAMRTATGCALVSIEEIETRGYDAPQKDQADGSVIELRDQCAAMEANMKKLGLANDARITMLRAKNGQTSTLDRMNAKGLDSLAAEYAAILTEHDKATPKLAAPAGAQKKGRPKKQVPEADGK